MAEIKVPQLGESIVEATVGRWLKQEGDSIVAGEPVVELETDKVNMEVPATASGTLQRIVQPEGETVGIGDVLAVVAEGAASASSSGQAAEPTAAPTPASNQPTAQAQPQSAVAAQAPPVDPNGEEPRSTPLARRIASEHGVDLSRIEGTGPSGRVTREDVASYLETHPAGAGQPASTQVSPSQAPASSAPSAPLPTTDAASGRWEERVRMSRRRQTIARRLVEAQHTAAMLTTFNEVDMTAVMDLRKRRRDAFKERHGVGLGFMSFFTRAVVGGLKAFPRLNAEIQGDEIILKHYYDVGIAVDTEDGLVVPVVRDADRLSFAQIEQQIVSLAEKARNRTLTLEELQGGTFTITNGGIFGSLMSTPILNAPQVGILGMHKIQERPVALNGEVAIRPMMYLALSYDHRIVDGREAVQFLVRVKELLEQPEVLLLEG